MANSILIAGQENGSSLISWTLQTLRNPINRDKVVLLVEGDSDKTLFERLYSKDKVVVLPINKCSVVVNVIQALHRYKRRLVGVKDADFDRLNLINYSFENLFLTDAHDMEMMVLCSSKVLDNISCKYLAKQKDINTIRDRIYRDLLPLSMLKWYNSKCSDKITFDKTNPASCCVNGRFDWNQYSGKLFSLDANKNKEPKNETYNKWCNSHRALLLEITNGHDAMKLLYQYVRSIYKKNLKEKDFIKGVIDSYPDDVFKETKLGVNLYYWAVKNYGESLQ